MHVEPRVITSLLKINIKYDRLVGALVAYTNERCAEDSGFDSRVIRLKVCVIYKYLFQSLGVFYSY